MTVSAHVDNRPLRLAFRIPEACPVCFRDGNIRPGQTIRGRVVDLSWCCAACGHEWPVVPTEQERRMNGDRRDFTQPDRRRHSTA